MGHLLKAAVKAGRTKELRQEWLACDMAAFLAKWRCCHTTALKYLGPHKNVADTFKSRVDRGELDVRRLRDEWLSCENEEDFARKYRTTPSTCRNVLGVRFGRRAKRGGAKAVPLTPEDIHREQWKMRALECARMQEESRALYGDEYPEHGPEPVALK